MGLQFRCLLLIMIVAFSGVYGDGQGRKSLSYGGLSDNYYSHSCPQAEYVIQKVVSDELDKDLSAAAGLVRLQFHDCFVEGCDGSVLLDGPDSEKTAEVNEALDGFEIIDAAKAAVEAVCPGVVSCADVLTYVARDAAVKVNASYWEVQGGRLDGFHSSVEVAEAELPEPDFDASKLIDLFAKKGLSAEDLVTLSGAHTLGVTHCDHVVDRLYNFNGKGYQDPSLNTKYAKKLKKICPKLTFNTTVEVTMDPFTPIEFDAKYFKGLKQHKGIFTSDQSLLTDDRTKGAVHYLAKNKHFLKEFGKSMRALAAIGVKSGHEGEIRKHCHSVNHR